MPCSREEDATVARDGGEAPVELPIDGVLDLHAFHPRDVKSLVSEYIEECRRRGILTLRIIHGKGNGTLRRIVNGILETHPAVRTFSTAGHGSGGWGATIVDLDPPQGRQP